MIAVLPASTDHGVTVELAGVPASWRGPAPRILHVATRHLEVGGAARNLHGTLEWEARRGCEVRLLAGAGSDVDRLPRGVTAEVVPELVREVDPRRDLRAVRRIGEAIRRFVPDVVHTHQSKAGVLGRIAARRSGAVVVHTVHMASFGQGYSRVASAAFRAAERRCSRWTDHFVTVGEELAGAYVAAGIGRAEQYTVIHSPVDVARFAAARAVTDHERRAILARFDLPAGVPLLLGCGLLERRKRWDLLLRSLAPLLRRGDAVLALAGSGREETALRGLATSLGVATHVRLLGYVDDLPDLFAVAAALVHTSSVEGVPQVAVQAVAAGLPVIATEVQGVRELPAGCVEIVSADGTGLLDACRRVVATPRRCDVPLEALRPWTAVAIAERTAALHRRVAAAVARRVS